MTDNSGCEATGVAVINEPTAVDVTFTTTDANCGASDGSATANVTGGTPAYSYVWSTGATTGTISGLAAGSYDLTVPMQQDVQAPEQLPLAT